MVVPIFFKKNYVGSDMFVKKEGVSNFFASIWGECKEKASLT